MLDAVVYRPVRISEERAAWVRTHARHWQLDPLRRLRKVEVRMLNGLRLALVARKAAEGEEIERRAKGHLDEDCDVRAAPVRRGGPHSLPYRT